MFILIPLSLIFNTLFCLYRCHDPDFGHILALPRFYIYPLQGIMLSLILFIRLVSIFNDTKFRLSRCTIIVYVGLVIFGFVTTVIGNSLIELQNDDFLHLIGFFIWVLAGIDYVFLIVWLNALFLHRMHKVHAASKMNINNRMKILNMITKTTILCVMSTSFIIIYLVVFMVYTAISGSMQFYIFIALLLVLDLYSNYLSVLLSYSYFNPWYDKLCGSCHNRVSNVVTLDQMKQTGTLNYHQMVLLYQVKNRRLLNQIEQVQLHLQHWNVIQTQNRSSCNSLLFGWQSVYYFICFV